MIKRLLLVFLLSALLFGGLFGWKFYKIRRSMSNIPMPPPSVVAVTEVKSTLWQPYLNTVGSLVAVSGIDVSNEIAGIVKAIHFKSGQSVERGAPLVELDSAIDDAELKGLKAEVQLAQVRFERSEKLVAKHYASKSDHDQNSALLSEAKAIVAAKQEVIKKKRIYAPFSGELGIRLVNIGQYLPAGTAMVSLQTIAPIYVDFSVPEAHLGSLQIGQQLSLSVQAYPGKNFNGEISAINPQIEVSTRNIKIRATLENKDHTLRPGMFADVRIMLSVNKEVLTLPDTAITYNPYGDSVFAVVSGQQGLTAQLKQVITGETRDGRIEIIKGLNAGERIVSAGQVKLRNGMPLTVDDKPAPGERGQQP
ncbi:MAG: efflux RND transporter periplasmic adaptor subunit [Methylococcaceae bacterium]|nr:efflux RND transporter periplasmic adaptor subunit [Methylococcaceae bacterium]